MRRQFGTVKSFSRSYGWIACEDGADVFAHYTSIEGEGYRVLRAGDRVSFGVEMTDRGRRATQIQVHGEVTDGNF